MNEIKLDRELALEAGFVLFGALLLGGLGILVAGRLGGGTERARRRAQPAPRRGSVRPERHRNIATVAAR